MTPWLPERLWQDEFCNAHSGMVVARRPPKKIALISTPSGSSLSGSSRMPKIPSRRIARASTSPNELVKQLSNPVGILRTVVKANTSSRYMFSYKHLRMNSKQSTWLKAVTFGIEQVLFV
jgi:hypothetical protein